MSLLQWKPEFSIGIAAMDDEHREMIELINEVYAKLGDAADHDAIEVCLEEIYHTIALHFALEERIMRDSLYEEYGAHKDDHEDLLDEIRSLMDVFADDQGRGAELLERRLSNWFGRHFASFDARLHGKFGVN